MNVYQSVKGMTAAEAVCREGGVIVMVAGCSDGHGGEIIKLYAVKRKGYDFNEADFRKYLKNNLDNYKRPREVEFRESLPKNSLRKILKKDLRKEAIEKMKERLATMSAEN